MAKDLVALIHIQKCIPLKQENALLLEGEAIYEITAGMFYRIPFNRSFGITYPIDHVVKLDDNRVQLKTCFETEEDLDFILFLNIGDEVFEIYDSSHHIR